MNGPQARRVQLAAPRGVGLGGQEPVHVPQRHAVAPAAHQGLAHEALDVGHLRRARPPQMPFGGEARERADAPPVAAAGGLQARHGLGREQGVERPVVRGSRVVQVPAGVGAVPIEVR